MNCKQNQNGTLLIAEYVRELLAISKDGCIGRSGFQVLFVCSVLAIAGCGDSEQDAKSGNEPRSAETDRVVIAGQQLELGHWDAAAEMAYLALVESPDDHDATIVAAKAEAARGEPLIAVRLLRSLDLGSRRGKEVATLLIEQHLALSEPWEAADVLLSALILYPQEEHWRVQAWGLLNRCGRRHEGAVQAAWLCRHGKASRQHLESLVSCSFAYPLPDISGLDATDFEEGLGRARFYYTLQDYRRAIDELRDDRFSRYAKRPVSLALEGRLLTELQMFDEVPEWFARCDSRVQLYGDYWAAVGTFLFDQQNYDGSVAALLRAIALDPTDRISVQRMSRGLAALKRAEDSAQFRYRGTQLAKCEQALEKMSEPSELQIRVRELQGLFLELGRPFEAIGWTLLGASSRRQRLAVDQQRQVLIQQPEVLNIASESALLGLKHEDFTDLSNLQQWMGGGQGLAELEREYLESGVLPKLTNVAEELGLKFQWYQDFEVNPTSIPIHESLGGGIGVLDYDLDGWPDLYIGQGSGEPPSSRCTRSSILFARKDDRFADCTGLAGVSDYNYSSGIAVGDVNQDGFPDLLLGALGRNRLLINNGDGTFTDHTKQLGIQEDRFTSSLAIGDINGDALPDLYEVNYIEMEGGFELPKKGPGGREILPSPLLHYPDSDRWLQNLGDGTFKPHSIDRGIAEPGTGLGIVITDFDEDGSNEIFVGNDVRPNHFLSLIGDQKFENSADARGLANGFEGTANGCMGIATGDFNRDLKIDLHVTNYFNEAANLFLQAEAHGFTDQAIRYGVAEVSRSNVGFGTKAVDFDRNGWLDLAVTNGHIFDLRVAGHPFRMLPQIMMNSGRTFGASDVQGDDDYWDTPVLGRTMVKLDHNCDGALDLVIGHLDHPLVLLENQTTSPYPWLQIQLVGTKSERNAIGARIRVITDRAVFAQWVTSGDGYLCSDETVIDFGLGNAGSIQRVEVDWPSGLRQTFENVNAGHRYLLIENQNQPFVCW